MVANNGEEGVVERGKNVVESSTTRSTISKSHKRGCAPPSDDSVLTDLSDQLKEIVMALKEINKGLVDYNSLYSEAMAMVADRYSEDMFTLVFTYHCIIYVTQLYYICDTIVLSVSRLCMYF